MRFACYDRPVVKRPQAKTDIQVRGVPVALRDKARGRAKAQGRSLSHYVRDLIEADVAALTLEEWFEQIRRRGPIRPRGMRGKTMVDVLYEARREDGWEG